MKAVVLLSGGLDSLAALLWTWKEVGRENTLPIYVDLGHRYAIKEIKAVNKLSILLNFNYKIETVRFVGLKEKVDAHIPWCNLFLIITAVYHLPENDKGMIVIQNTQVGETSVRDRTIEFNQEVSKLLSWLEEKDIKVISPFATHTKGQIVRYLLDSGISIETIKSTVGCFSEEEGHCGECVACFRRFIALETVGIKCRDWFNKDPLKWEEVRKYLEKMLRSEYHDWRAIETLSVLKRYNVLKGVVAVDFDGVIAEKSDWWTFGEPITQNIQKINQLYDSGYGIWIYTARFSKDRKDLEEWLNKNGVKFHRIVTDKLYAHYYIDDKNANLEEVG